MGLAKTAGRRSGAGQPLHGGVFKPRNRSVMGLPAVFAARELGVVQAADHTYGVP